MADLFALNLRHLGAAVAVRRCGGISAAAQAVNLSQPALTQALRRLEAAVGHQLFVREASGARPSTAGTLFLDRAERALANVAAAARAVRRGARLPAIAHPERIIAMTQLRAFEVVERRGSYAAAAREIGLSQPSVHRAAKELELVLGVALLARVGLAMRATAPGERLARGVRLAVAELRAGLDEVEALSVLGAGRIRVGTLPLPRAGLLPEALGAFSRTHPHAEVTIIEGPYAELLAELGAGGVDMLLGALRDPAPDGGFVQRALFEDGLHIVARPAHPLAGRDPGLAELARFPWVVGAAGAPMRRTWEAMFAGPVRPASRIECASVLTTRGLLLEGDWLALMSPDQFRMEEAAGVLARIGGRVPGSTRSIGLVTRGDWRPTGAQADFVRALEHAAERRR